MGQTMKPFEMLTFQGQVRRLRSLAKIALDQYGLEGARLKLVAHGENTTFRVDVHRGAPVKVANERYVENRYLLRIHRPGYQTAESIRSELAWLAALRRDTALAVPEPVPALNGEWLVEAAAPGVPGLRNCSLFRWMRGRRLRRPIRPRHFRALGRLLAQLHHHAASWGPPPGFTRRHWDWEGLFGDQAGFNLSGTEIWGLLPPPYYAPFEAVASQVRGVMAELGYAGDVFGLIHADLFLGGDGNVLFSGGEARPIDFDDCGYGFWVYDLAVPLCHWQGTAAWPAVRDALLDSYTQIRPLPEKQLTHLDLFMAARHVSEILWAVDQAQVNPRFHKELGGWLAWAAKHIQGYLDRSEVPGRALRSIS
jgi:Ser/Thr protein kinase RdoA (MazF antagonist)